MAPVDAQMREARTELQTFNGLRDHYLEERYKQKQSCRLTQTLQREEQMQCDAQLHGQRPEQIVRRSDEAAAKDARAMHRQLSDQRQRTYEQRQQLTVAQRQIMENVQGKTDYEQYAYHEMQRVMGKHALLELRAQIQAVDVQGHRERSLTMNEIRKQQAYMQR